MNKAFNILILLIPIAFIWTMLEVLGQLFLNPSIRISIGEPNRWVSGLEIFLGAMAIIVLLLMVIEEIKSIKPKARVYEITRKSTKGTK